MEYIVAHLVGDYILQNDWQAMNKKKSYIICAVHVLLYMLPFLFLPISYLALALVAVQHFVQDKTNFVVWFMKVKGSARFAEAPMAPWSIIVTDNVLHLSWIYLVITYMK